MVFSEETEIRDALDEYIRVFLVYQNTMNDESISDEERLEVILEYADAADELTRFMEDTYGKGTFELPNPEIYFSGEAYHDYAYRIYRAVLRSGQYPKERERNLKVLVYIGEVLRNHFVG